MMHNFDPELFNDGFINYNSLSSSTSKRQSKQQANQVFALSSNSTEQTNKDFYAHVEFEKEVLSIKSSATASLATVSKK